MSEPDVLLTPPDAAEAAVLVRGIVSAAEGPGGLTPLQGLLIRATFHSMTGHEVDPARCAPISPGDFAAALARRNKIFRTRIVQVMLLAALVFRPLPGQVATQLRSFTEELPIRDHIIVLIPDYTYPPSDLPHTLFLSHT